MNTPLQHDYIGFSNAPLSAGASESVKNVVRQSLRETQLRLCGLERSIDSFSGVSIFGKDLAFSASVSPSKNRFPVCRANRDMSDAINDGKCVVSKPGVENLLSKGGGEGLFSPRRGSCKNDEC